MQVFRKYGKGKSYSGFFSYKRTAARVKSAIMNTSYTGVFTVSDIPMKAGNQSKYPGRVHPSV